MPRHRETAAEEIEGFADTLFKFASPEDMLGEVDPSLNADWNDLFFRGGYGRWWGYR